MDPSDQEKTSFMTGQGTYCYQVMPFRLKNAGATYQRLVKSVKAELNVTHLDESFQVLKNYNMKLNPTKCAFGVSVKKFLGFIVNSRGI